MVIPIVLKSIIFNMNDIFSKYPISASVISFLAVRWLLLIIYRTQFHPLSAFPGPKLAASTSLYSHYFNFVQGGNFIRQLEYLHDIYGGTVTFNRLHSVGMG